MYHFVVAYLYICGIDILRFAPFLDELKTIVFILAGNAGIMVIRVSPDKFVHMISLFVKRISG